MSKPGASLFRRKTSRISRFALFRTTAPPSLLVAAIPSRQPWDGLARMSRSCRTVASTPLQPLVEAGWEPRADVGTDPAGLALAAADRERLAAHLAALPDRYRIPVVLRHVADLSYAELAEVLGRPEGTLKAQVHRGLAMLRAAMAGTELEELTA